MKIAGRVIQNRNIIQNDKDYFEANYKHVKIVITTDHGFGKPDFDHLTRYSIDVYGRENGIYDVEAVKDFHTMKDAIRYALEGACL